MKDQIKEILESEEFDSATKTDKIAKIIGEQTVIKSKYNEKIAELDLAKSEKESINEQLETIKTNSMTQEEKNKKQEEMAKSREAELSKKINRIDAIEIFANAGVKKEVYDSLIDDLVSEDSEKTKIRVQKIAEQFVKQVEDTTTLVKQQLMKETPRPGSTQDKDPGDGNITKEQFAKMGGFERTELRKTSPELFEQLASTN